ncbi:hypothetical protein RSW31_25180, partial [Escherichia coli]|uniref:hypothetical protein n=1 Tax=Escherichia coli TaxID=562 RepID=UPI0028DD9575
MQELRKRSADAIAFDEHQNAVSGGTGSDEHVADDSKRVAQLESQIEALKEEVRESQTTAAKAEDRLASLRA